MKKLNIVLPAHNEHNNISPIYKEIILALASCKYPYEILFIDDGSTDDTLAQIKALSAEDSKVKYIELSRNFGHQNALKAGLDMCNADIIIMMDCDLQHPPHLINELLRNYELGYEIVRTHRIDSKSVGFIKSKTSSLFYNIISKFSDIKIEEGSADFRLISGSAITHLKSFNEFDLFYRGLIKWMGYKQISIEYMAELRYSFYAFYSGTEVHGWASVIATVAFFGGLNLMILGIIGFYLSKLVIQSKNRPHYIVKACNL